MQLASALLEQVKHGTFVYSTNFFTFGLITKQMHKLQRN